MSIKNYITEFDDPANRPKNLEVEPEEEVDADAKGPYILHSDMKKAMKKDDG
jgi:hypothetical protein